MFLLLLGVTLLAAFGTAYLVARAFAGPLDRIVKRLIPDAISTAWSGYLHFAILVIGVASGVRVRDLDKYVTPAIRGEKETRVFDFTFDRWALELYRTVIDTLQGITWMLLLFFIFAMVTYVIVRIAELRFGPNAEWPRHETHASASPADDGSRPPG